MDPCNHTSHWSHCPYIKPIDMLVIIILFFDGKNTWLVKAIRDSLSLWHSGRGSNHQSSNQGTTALPPEPRPPNSRFYIHDAFTCWLSAHTSNRSLKKKKLSCSFFVFHVWISDKFLWRFCDAAPFSIRLTSVQLPSSNYTHHIFSVYFIRIARESELNAHSSDSRHGVECDWSLILKSFTSLHVNLNAILKVKPMAAWKSLKFGK